jgi:hypothetical protein
MIAGVMQQGYAPSEKADLSKASVRGGKTLTESQYSFLLEPYENGAPAPTLLQQEVPVSDASPFLLTDPDFSKMDVVKAYVHTIVAPLLITGSRRSTSRKEMRWRVSKQLAYSIPFM